MFTIYKKHLSTLALLMLMFWVSAFTSCKNDDEAPQTYNFLESFGPCPIARGGELTFIGADLSSVQSVEFPGGETVTPTFISSGKFTVKVPESALPGNLILHTSNGDITTLSPIGFSEPVEVVSFSPQEQRPGSEVTITGKYLSNATYINIGEVKIPLQPISDDQKAIFDKYVTSLTNTELKFKVPAEAATGDLTLTDGKPVLCGELTVTLPKFTAYTESEELLPGTDEVTINGTNIDLVTKVVFASGAVVNASDMELTATSATFTLPLAAGDGDVKIITASGIEVEAGAITTIKPVITNFGGKYTIDPYCDDIFAIQGTNLELIKAVVLAHKADKEQTVTEFSSASETEIQFAVPEYTGSTMAWSNEVSAMVPTGELYIITHSGERIKITDDETKLRIGYASIGESSNYEITAGDLVTMTGCTNTAYITKVEADGVVVDFTKISKNSYSFVWPITKPGNNLILRVYFTNEDNNSNEYSGSKFSVTATSKIFVTEYPEQLLNGSAALIKGGNFNKVTKVTINGIEQVFALKDDNTLFLNVSGVAKSPAEIVFVAEKSSDNFTINLPVEGLALPLVPISNASGEPMTFPFTDGWGPGQCYLVKSAQLSKYVAVGAKITFKVTVSDGGGQWQINNSSWQAYTTLTEWSKTGQDVELVLELTQQMVDDYNAMSDGDHWIIMQGAGLTINYIEIL